jgi:guanylate kinase
MTSGARLVVVSGPSGVGKTSVCALLEKREEFERVITATTREPRGAEKHGEHYLFHTKEEFESVRSAGGFLECATVHGHSYGTPRAQAEAILARGHQALLNIDVQGAAQIRDAGVACLLIFLSPPDFETLEKRLRGRATDTNETVQRRLETARQEYARRSEFDIEVINADLATAAAEILAAL